MRFDIQVTISVENTTEAKAELAVIDFLKKSDREFGNHYKVVDWQLTEFIPSCDCEYQGCSDVGCSSL